MRMAIADEAHLLCAVLALFLLFVRGEQRAKQKQKINYPLLHSNY